MLGVVIVLSGVLAFAATGSVNYCGAKMCGNTNTHTYCQYPEGPSPKCIDYQKVKLRSVEKTRLLKRFNSGRNKAALGMLNGLPPAGNMMKLHWVEELAREAQRWADQCRPPRPIEEHDTCRDLYSLTVGQCVASVVGIQPVRVDYMVDIWNKQAQYYNYTVSSYEPPSNGSKYYGDFAQLYWAKSYMVGCARSRFKTYGKHGLISVERLVCNVAPAGPKRHRRLWVSSAPTDMCPYRTRPSKKWPTLCDYPETVRELQEALQKNEREYSRMKGKHNKKVLHRVPRSLKKHKKPRRHDDDDDEYGDEGSGSLEKLLNEEYSQMNKASCVSPSLLMILVFCLQLINHFR